MKVMKAHNQIDLKDKPSAKHKLSHCNRMLNHKKSANSYLQKYRTIRKKFRDTPKSELSKRTQLMQLNIKLQKQYLKYLNKFYRLKWMCREKEMKKWCKREEVTPIEMGNGMEKTGEDETVAVVPQLLEDMRIQENEAVPGCSMETN